MGLLDGKKGLILNIANDRSIAWHIANNAVKHGAKCGFGYLPMEKMERRVRKAMEEGGFGTEWLYPCDVSKDEDIEKFFAAARDQFGTIDFLVHSLAFANRDYLAIGKFLSTPRDVFKQALDISAYSLIALARGAAPLMPNGGSILALTYLGSEKAVPGYNVMGVAKAALESSSRYLALEMGEKKSASTRCRPVPFARSAPWPSAGLTKCSRTTKKNPRSSATSKETKSAKPPFIS
jgi:enoyl-[acyl-carrier protein] reductase I